MKKGVPVTPTVSPATPAPAATVAEKAKPAPWALEANFPQPPKTLSSEQPSPVGPVRQTTLAAAEGQIVYALSRVAFPMAIAADQIDSTFATTRDNLVKEGKGTLQREEKLSVADLPGRRYVVEYHDFVFDDYRVDYRVVLIDRTMYIAFYRAPLTIYSRKSLGVFQDRETNEPLIPTSNYPKTRSSGRPDPNLFGDLTSGLFSPGFHRRSQLIEDRRRLFPRETAIRDAAAVDKQAWLRWSCVPPRRLLSSITAAMRGFPGSVAIWAARSAATATCRSGSFTLLVWLQSTIR